GELDRVMEEGFIPTPPGQPVREEMLSSFKDAVAAYPAHVGANVELLLDLADLGRWHQMLNDARRFAWASQGHPYGLLLSGLALHRMGRSDEAMEDFELALHGLPEDEARLLTDVRPLLSADERRDLESLQGEARRKAESRFWRRLDPILLTEVNEREVEHLARATYAWLRFGGIDTDAGDVWVRYGRPLAVRTLGGDTGVRTEFWDYGRGPDLTFRRPAVSTDLDLTPEAGAYLEEVGQNLLHRYGRQSRLVVPLEAQVGRFRASDDRRGEVTLATRVPEALATGGEDSLQLGLFVLGPDGERISETRRLIPARASAVRMEAPVPRGASVVALEMYHPTLRQVGVVRSRVSREPSEGEDPRISDILLVEPATPLTRDIRRDEAWIIPRTDPGDVSGSDVGLLFELYDVAPVGAYYRMRVELEPRDGGRRVAVPYRPSGTERFGDEWPRTSAGKGPITEFLTLDLEDVGPGRYTLRLTVDPAGGGGPILVERPVRR
ncbi:MAG TPA: GWxTD domain-containing protein, partial [Longimicrobiales bacterium]|nr:GWxTD domain-containing protein [Longimicrobiales bacterium]